MTFIAYLVFYVVMAFIIVRLADFLIAMIKFRIEKDECKYPLTWDEIVKVYKRSRHRDED